MSVLIVNIKINIHVLINKNLDKPDSDISCNLRKNSSSVLISLIQNLQKSKVNYQIKFASPVNYNMQNSQLINIAHATLII